MSKQHASLLSDQPRNLPPGVVKNSYEYIDTFFLDFDMAACRERLWNLLKGLMNSEESDGWDHVERSNYIHFFESLETLIEANYVLHQRYLKRNNRKQESKR